MRIARKKMIAMATSPRAYPLIAYPKAWTPGTNEIEYNARTHHSNMDLYERVQAQDMMRNAVIVASFVYNTANRDERLPRKPLPKPVPPPARSNQ